MGRNTKPQSTQSMAQSSQSVSSVPYSVHSVVNYLKCQPETSKNPESLIPGFWEG